MDKISAFPVKNRRILAAVASKSGFSTVMAAMVLTCISMWGYTTQTMQQLAIDHEVFKDTQLRNGYVAMSDIQRLLHAAQMAQVDGFTSEAVKSEFSSATDILYVRIGSFERLLTQQQTPPSGHRSITALKNILTIADQAITNDFPDVNELNRSLISAAMIARSSLVQFTEVIRRRADQVLEDQYLALRNQQWIISIALAGFSIFCGLALILLRREIISRNARDAAEEQVKFLAYFDPLTRMPNRVQFQQTLQDLLNRNQKIALLLVDLDGFKVVNDTYGHATGDMVLKHAGQNLARLSTEMTGFAARLGGDEFAVVVPTEDSNAILELCGKIMKIAAKPLHVRGEAIAFGLSVGIATTAQTKSSSSRTVDALSRFADFALYESKTQSPNSYSFYDLNLEKKFLERRALVDDLPRAVQDQQLEVFYQPKVSLTSRKITGFEGLVRWRRDGHLVQPTDFIQVAEETGMIQLIDRFVLRDATKSIADHNAKTGDQLSVSVNLSGLHFSSDRIVDWVEQALWDSGLSPKLLTLEITETVELRDWHLTGQILDELKALGVLISIDDFGTGYSSLAYLRTTMAHELKIDRSLVKDIEGGGKAQKLLASVLEIARQMELKIVVEGVETEAQTKILTSLNVETVQGFYFGRPMPLGDALAAFEVRAAAS